MFRERYFSRIRSQCSNNELTGKIRHAAALTSWRLLAGVDVVAAQDQPNNAEGLISTANPDVSAAPCRMWDTLGCPWWMVLRVLCLQKLLASAFPC